MTNINTTTYIKKLVKIVYEKEKQIQALKNTLKTKQSGQYSRNQQIYIDPELKNQLQNTSTQLKVVNRQLMTMEEKILELSSGLQEEISKNIKLEEENTELKYNLASLHSTIQQQVVQLQQKQHMIANLVRKNDSTQQKQAELVTLNEKLEEKLRELEELKTKQKYQHTLVEKQINSCRSELKKKENQSKNKQSELKLKSKEFQQIQSKLQAALETNMRENAAKNQQSIQIQKLKQENSLHNHKIQALNSQLSMKANQCQLISQKLKDFQQFAFQISHYIEASYLKHCTRGATRSSKKILKEMENYHSKFEQTINKMNKLQLWMDSAAQKIQKLVKQQQLPCTTLQNLSIIVRSFEEKLDLCNLTSNLQKEKEKQRLELEKNQEQLLCKLQKECEKSYERQQSKVVELGELKEVLKMTKEVNRELMDEVNQKQHIINECRKTFVQMLGNKPNAEFKAIKMLLNIAK